MTPWAAEVEMTMRKPSLAAALIFLVALAGSGLSQAEVLDSAANGFTTRYSVDIAESRLTVYRALVNDVGAWWNDNHTVSGVAANMTIDAIVHGCFCENLGDGSGLVHMAVTFVNPGVMLRMTGGLGPLGLMGVAGNMTFEINEADNVSTIVLQYAVGGYMAGGLDEIAAAVDGVLIDALNRLKQFVEEGDE